MNDTPLLSASQAAKEYGKSVPTITRAIKSGKLTATKKPEGGYEIDRSELIRLYGFPPSPDGNATSDATPPMSRRSSASETSALDTEVKMLREQIERMDATAEREREQAAEQIEQLRIQIERQSQDHRQALAAITDQRSKEPVAKRKGFWARLVG